MLRTFFVILGALLPASSFAADCPRFHFFAYLNAIHYEMQVNDCDSFHWIQDRSDANYLDKENRWAENIKIPTQGEASESKSFGPGRFFYEDGVLVREGAKREKYYFAIEMGAVCGWYQTPETANLVWSLYPSTDKRRATHCTRISGKLL